MASVIVNAILANYNLYTSFIANNGSNFHVINRFYRDRLINIRLANDIKVRHEPDVIPIELINDAYYNAYDQYDHLIKFDITGFLYVPDFIINIVSMRLTK